MSTKIKIHYYAETITGNRAQLYCDVEVDGTHELTYPVGSPAPAHVVKRDERTIVLGGTNGSEPEHKPKRRSKNFGKSPEAKAEMLERVLNACPSSDSMNGLATKDIADEADMVPSTALRKLYELEALRRVEETSGNKKSDFRWKKAPIRETRIVPGLGTEEGRIKS